MMKKLLNFDFKETWDFVISAVEGLIEIKMSIFLSLKWYAAILVVLARIEKN